MSVRVDRTQPVVEPDVSKEQHNTRFLLLISISSSFGNMRYLKAKIEKKLNSGQPAAGDFGDRTADSTRDQNWRRQLKPLKPVERIQNQPYTNKPQYIRRNKNTILQ